MSRKNNLERKIQKSIDIILYIRYNVFDKYLSILDSVKEGNNVLRRRCEQYERQAVLERRGSS